MAISEVGNMVRVETPFPLYALPRVWTWIEDFRDQVADDYSPKTLVEFVQQWQKRTNQKTWGVWRDQELGGLVTWEPGPTPAVGVTHALFKKEFWGRAITHEALSLVYAELFSSGVRKVMGFPFKKNHAIISLAKELGARTEGTLRSQTLRNGKPIDVVVLGLLKEDFEKCRFSPHSSRLSLGPEPASEVRCSPTLKKPSPNSQHSTQPSSRSGTISSPASASG